MQLHANPVPQATSTSTQEPLELISVNRVHRALLVRLWELPLLLRANHAEKEQQLLKAQTAVSLVQLAASSRAVPRLSRLLWTLTMFAQFVTLGYVKGRVQLSNVVNAILVALLPLLILSSVSTVRTSDLLH